MILDVFTVYCKDKGIVKNFLACVHTSESLDLGDSQYQGESFANRPPRNSEFSYSKIIKREPSRISTLNFNQNFSSDGQIGFDLGYPLSVLVFL